MMARLISPKNTDFLDKMIFRRTKFIFSDQAAITKGEMCLRMLAIYFSSSMLHQKERRVQREIRGMPKEFLLKMTN